jgi:flavin-dependent dehydrogenase
VEPERLSADVAIVGGGPAGSAAALTLLKYSDLRVALIERSTYSAFRIGECLGPSAAELLRYLGAEETLTQTKSRASQGVAAAWGSSRLHTQDFIFTGRGPGWHVDRRRFDEALVGNVERGGGQLLLDARVVDVRYNAGREWTLHLRRSASRQRITVSARYLIDATGKQAVIARGQGAKFEVQDRLVGISGVYRFRRSNESGGITTVEAVPSGWWYTAQLPHMATGGHVIAVFLTDMDIARRHGYRTPTNWKRSLARTEHTRQRLRDGELCGPLRLHAAHSRKLMPQTGPGWIAAGDAAVSFDPLASMGIGYALLSGIEAGRVAHNVLTGSGKLAETYAKSINHHFARYMKLRAAYYQCEQRWPGQPFWRRRHMSYPVLRQSSIHPEDCAESRA